LTSDLTLKARQLLDKLKQIRGIGRVSAWQGGAPMTRARANGSIERQQAVPKLRAWIAQNGRELEGHADYETLSKEEKQQVQPLGWYMPEAVYLPLSVVETALGYVPDGFKSKRIGFEHGLHIPIGELAKHPPLFQWCKENASRIEGHPRYQEWESLNVLGIYEVEAVALPLWQYEWLLGALPEGAEEFAVYVGEEEWRHQRVLYKVRLNGKVSF
jgi:hypothetical protein